MCCCVTPNNCARSPALSAVFPSCSRRTRSVEAVFSGVFLSLLLCSRLISFSITFSPLWDFGQKNRFCRNLTEFWSGFRFFPVRLRRRTFVFVPPANLGSPRFSWLHHR